MKKVFYVLIFIALFIILSIVSVRFVSPEDFWACENGVWTMHGKPDSPMPSGPCGVVLPSDPMDTTFVIGESIITFENGYSEILGLAGESDKIVTRIFGEPFLADANKDGMDDAMMFITQESGGSGVFYYFAVAVATDKGFVGTESFPLGDRIAPQNINLQENGIIAVNYAERRVGEPMTTRPSVGVTLYAVLENEILSLVPQNVGQGGILPMSSGIIGTMTVGPQCPIVEENKSCPDSPFVGAVNIYRELSSTSIISNLKTNKDGVFNVSLSPGTYMVKVEDSKKYPKCPETKVVVGPKEKTRVYIACDSGIR